MTRDKELDRSKQRIEHVYNLIESVGALTRGEALQIAFGMIMSLYNDSDHKIEFVEELHKAFDELCVENDKCKEKKSDTEMCQ